MMVSFSDGNLRLLESILRKNCLLTILTKGLNCHRFLVHFAKEFLVKAGSQYSAMYISYISCTYICLIIRLS